MIIPTRRTEAIWHDSVPTHVAVIRYWIRPMKEYREWHRDPEGKPDHWRRRCRVFLRPRGWDRFKRSERLEFTVTGVPAARRRARALLSDMADLADPAALAVARVKEGTEPFTGWARLPAHYMDFLTLDLEPTAYECGCEGLCVCSVALARKK